MYPSFKFLTFIIPTTTLSLFYYNSDYKFLTNFVKNNEKYLRISKKDKN